MTLTPGSKVHYVSFGKPPENGIVKALNLRDPKTVFVVYHCDGNWDRYQNYTAASTRIEDLREGWV